MSLDSSRQRIPGGAITDEMRYEDVFMHDKEVYEFVGATKTLDIEDCGKTLLVTADAFTITLPATVIGYRYRIVNFMADAGCLVTIDPNGSDGIYGIDYTGTDGGAMTNTKATAKRGDFVELVADGDAGWFVDKCAGIWVIAE